MKDNSEKKVIKKVHIKNLESGPINVVITHPVMSEEEKSRYRKRLSKAIAEIMGL